MHAVKPAFRTGIQPVYLLRTRAGYEVTHFMGLFERPTFVDAFAEGKYVRTANSLALDGFFFQMGLSF